MGKLLAKMGLRLVINGNQMKGQKIRGANNLPGAHKNPQRGELLSSCPSSCSVNLFVG